MPHELVGQRQGFAKKFEFKVPHFTVLFIFLLEANVLSLAFQVIEILLLGLANEVLQKSF